MKNRVSEKYPFSALEMMQNCALSAVKVVVHLQQSEPTSDSFRDRTVLVLRTDKKEISMSLTTRKVVPP
ncbi:hypothetical protein J6590_053516 [Homalodisca vitripennis]|nr:hypothetical protein J6590_053516 [Homalodisca vitripennis]